MEHTDVIIIGAGPAGLFAGFYVGMRGLSFRFLDPLPEPGGQLSASTRKSTSMTWRAFPRFTPRTW